MRIIVALLLLLHTAAASYSCSCYYEFPASGPYAVTECIGTDANATCACPELTNPLVNAVGVPCPGKVVIQGVPGFVYDTRALCARLTPATATTVPKHLLPCVGAQCGGNTTGLVTFISSVTRTLNATVPLCSFTTRTETCVDSSSCAPTCQVSDWSPWTGCNRVCGTDSVRTRTRRIVRLPLGLNATTSCPSLIQTLPCTSLSACNVSEPAFVNHTRNCTASEQTLSGNGTACRVTCVDSTRFDRCRFASSTLDLDLYRRCGLHSLAFNGSACACASANHVTSFSGLPCNGIRTQCDATDVIPTNVSTWVTQCTSTEAMSSLTNLVDVYSRRREVEFRCRSNETCPAALPLAGIRRCANVSEVNATCGLPNANATCYISCWTVSDCRGMAVECTCPNGTVRDLTQSPPCRNQSYIRNCTDSESTRCDGCVSFSAPGVCALGNQCLANCSTATGDCQIIPDTCGNTTTRRVQCQDADRIRFCGASAVGCFMDATENVLTGTLETFPSTVQCACGNDQAAIPFVPGGRSLQWGYGVPCASTATLDLPCTRTQMQQACGVSLGAEATTVQWDPRFCLQRNGRVLNGTCPDDYVLRNCTDAEFYQWCPLAEHASCRAACNINGTDCRLFGRCAVQRPCTSDEAVLYCNRFATNCTLQQWDEPIVGRRAIVNRSTCSYECESPWFGEECAFNINDGPCPLDRWAWFCGAPWQSSNCTSLNVTTVRCSCRSGYGNPIPTRPNQTLSVAADQLLPYCSGFYRPCNDTEVPLHAGPYGASCGLFCHEVLQSDCALANYTCQPGSFPEYREAYVQQSTNTLGVVFVPCSTNRQTLVAYSEPSLVQRVCGRGGFSVDVAAVYNGALIESYEAVNGTCKCQDGYFASGSVPCHSLYYTRDCTATERALVPAEIVRDCPTYVCRRLCYPPRGVSRELCFAHEPHPCLDNFVSPYWTQMPKALAQEKCGDFVDKSFASCSFASDLTFSPRCTGRVRCHCFEGPGVQLAYQNDTTALTQKPCDEMYQVQPCADQWEAIALCQSVFAQNCTKRTYPSSGRPPEPHVCTCAKDFSVLTSVRRCATNVSGEVCPTNSKFFPPTTCGPLSFGVDYICDSGAPVLSCLSKCKCLPNAIEFFPGVPCSGYRRNCSMSERFSLCGTTDALCEMDCAASHAYGGSPLSCRLASQLPCPTLTSVDAIPLQILTRDCGPAASTCLYNGVRCNPGSCRCKPWPLGVRAADRCELTTTVHRPCWTDEPWLQLKPVYRCVYAPVPIRIRRPFLPDLLHYPLLYCNTEPDPVDKLDPLLKRPPLAIRVYCGENARSCRMRRFFVPSERMTFLVSSAMNVISDPLNSDVDFKWLMAYFNASVDPVTGATRRVFVDPDFRCSLERTPPRFTPNRAVTYARKIWCWQSRTTEFPLEFDRDLIFAFGGSSVNDPVINTQVNPFPKETLWPDTKTPFSLTPYAGQSFDDAFDSVFWLPECQCGGHPFAWIEQEGSWHAFYDLDGLAPLKPESKSAWTSYPFHSQFLERLRCDRRYENFEYAQGTCTRERRSKLTCNGMGHCRSWRHALKPLCSEYQNMYGFCLQERLLRSVYTAVEYEMLRYIPDLTFYFGTKDRTDKFVAWWNTLQSRGGIDIFKVFNGETWNATMASPDLNGWYFDRPAFISEGDWRLYTVGLLTQVEMYSRVQLCGRGTFTRGIGMTNRCDDPLLVASPTVWQQMACYLSVIFLWSIQPCSAPTLPWGIEAVFSKRSNFDTSACGAFVADLLADKLETGSAIPDACATLLYIVQGLPWIDGQYTYAPFAQQASLNADTYVDQFGRLFREGLSSKADAEYLARLYLQDWRPYLRYFADGVIDGLIDGPPDAGQFKQTQLGSNLMLLEMLQKLGECKQTKVGLKYTFNCTGYYEPYCKLNATGGRLSDLLLVNASTCLILDKRFVQAPSFFELIATANVSYPRNVQLTDFKCGRNYLQVVNCGVFSNYTGSCALAFDKGQSFYRTVLEGVTDLLSVEINETVPTTTTVTIGGTTIVTQGTKVVTSRVPRPLTSDFFSPLYQKRFDDIDRTTAAFKQSSGSSFCANVPCYCKVNGWKGSACDIRNCASLNDTCYLGFLGLCDGDIDAMTNANAFVGAPFLALNSWDGQYINRSCCEGQSCTLPFNWTGRVGCINGVYDWYQERCRCDAGWTTDPSGRCRHSTCIGVLPQLGCLNGGTCQPATRRCQCAPGFYGNDCIGQLSLACVGGCGYGECAVKPGTLNETQCNCITSRFTPGLPLPRARCPDPPLVGTWELDPDPPAGTCRYLDRTVFKIPRGVDVGPDGSFPCEVMECAVAGNCFCSKEYLEPNVTAKGQTIVVPKDTLCPRSAFPFPYSRDEDLFNAKPPICAATVILTNYSDPEPFYEWRGTRCDVPWAPCVNGGTPTHEPNGRHDPYRITCVCPSGYTGRFCEWPICPRSRTNVTCSGYDTNQCGNDCRRFDAASNGLRCTRNGVVDFSRQGCGCTHELRDGCQQPGTSSICSGITTKGADNQTLDTCQPYVDPLAGAIRYRCQCPLGRIGQWCQDTVCPIPSSLTGIITSSCNGRRCNTDATCSCDNVGLALPNDRLLEGPNCEYDVTTVCGYNPPGTASLLQCAGHGVCAYNASLTAFHCRCDAGYSGEFCQRSVCPVDCAFGDCVPAANGIESLCRCWDVNVYKRGPQGACNVSDCGAAQPNAAGDKCVCANSTLSPPDCTSTLCYRDSGNQLCGPLAAGDQYDVNSRTFSDGARETIDKQCLADGCFCGWRYRYTHNNTRCEPICHANNTVATLMEMDSTGRLPRDGAGTPVLRFGSCACKAGYTSVSNCTAIKCLRGFPLNADGSCNCSAAYTGEFCETSRCEGRGTVLSSGLGCTCEYPFIGTFCEDIDPVALVCYNNGTLLNATHCNCTFPYTGSDCLSNVCENGGEAVGDACVCTSRWTGPTCNLRVCANGGKRDDATNVCTCRTQYFGTFCEQRFCGTGGNRVVLGANESLCFCSGLWQADPSTGNCTLSKCVNGIPRDASSCVCNKPYVDRGGQFPNHRCRLDCEPEFGVYDETSSACLCNDTRFGLLCEKSIVEAIELNATTGQTHDVPLTLVNETVQVANPVQARSGSVAFELIADDDTVSDREPPVPTTLVPTGLPVDLNVSTDNGTADAFPVGEALPIGSTVLGVVGAIGGGMLVGLVSLVALVAL